MISRDCGNSAKITFKLYTQLPCQCGTRGYSFDLRLHLSSILYVRSEGSGETVQMR